MNGQQGHLNLVVDEFFRELTSVILTARKSILIVSPYVTEQGVRVVLDALEKRKVKCTLDKQFVTLPHGPEYIMGFVEPRALLMLKDAGFQIRVLKSLHARIYVVDDETSFIGSANATAYGFGNVKGCNKEIMLGTDLSPSQVIQIRAEYLTPAVVPYPEIDEDYVSELETRTAGYKAEHLKLMTKYSPPSPPPDDVYYRTVQTLQLKGVIDDLTRLSTRDFQTNQGKLKTFYSKVEVETSNYTFSITETTGRKIKEGLYDFVLLILGEKPEVVLGIPAKDFSKKILPGPRLNNGAWSLKVVRVNNSWRIKLRKHKSGTWYDADGLVWDLPVSWKQGRVSIAKGRKVPKA